MEVTITEDLLQKVITLRHELHQHPELSGEEVWTRNHLMNFLKEHTKLELHDMGTWFYALKKGKTQDNAIALRADFDAVPVEDNIDVPYRSIIPGVAHKCGHDGHSAALCGTAMLLDPMETERSVYFFFQPAEEVGKGGEACAEVLEKLPVSEVYAWHNRGEFPEKQIVVKAGSTQCASRGLTIFYEGSKSHASEPEKGVNPAFALAELVQRIAAIDMKSFSSRTQYTIIHLQVGTKDFGVSPAVGELSLTLRADLESDLDQLEKRIRCDAQVLAEREHLKLTFEISDPFPDTVNHPESVDKVIANARKLGLDVEIPESPWRPSEDFGYYTRVRPGAMFYVGTGVNWPPLHTDRYDFNDDVLETAMRMLAAMV